MMDLLGQLDFSATRVLLCDADGTLFGSEEPAFEASVEVTNAMMAELGSDRRFSAEGLRRATNGKNFRTTAPELAREAGVELTPKVLERWVREEKRAVTAHLEEVLSPDVAVRAPVRRLGEHFELAVVTSSAASRVATCLRVSALGDLFDDERLFSAEDSLPIPQSKPSPAVYLHAGEMLGVAGGEAVAVEDAVPGAQSAIAAGFPTIGCLMFVPAGERAERAEALRVAGVCAVADSWAEIEALLAPVCEAAKTAIKTS